MSDENPEIESAETEEGVQAQTEEQEEEVATVVGFGESEEKPEEKETPTVQEEKKDESGIEKEVLALRNQVANLNKALHQERQSKKGEKRTDEEETLTPDQLRQLMKEHKDDPDTMFNIMSYMMEQGSKKASREAIAKEEQSKKKALHDAYIAKRWPSMQDPNSELHQATMVAKKNLGIEDHPLSDYLAAASIICDQLDNIKNAEYERGKQDGLKGKVEDTRKKDVKESSLTPSGKTQTTGKSGTLKGTYADTAKQLNMTKSQKEIYAQLLKKKNISMEA